MLDQPNILLIIIDSARARNCSLYDHTNETTPTLETVAESATTYTQARSPGNSSVTSHTSIFTGHHVAEHECYWTNDQIKDEETIWESLTSEYSYDTGLFTNNLVIGKSTNLAEAFETVVLPDMGNASSSDERLFEDAFDPKDILVSEGVLGNLKRALDDDQKLKSIANCGWRAVQDTLVESETLGQHYKNIPANQFATEFLEWAESTDDPWAACVNVMDCHEPYQPLKKFDRWGGSDLRRVEHRLGAATNVFGDRYWWELEACEALYDGAILQADTAIDSVVSSLKKRDDWENTLVVITSDHGEGFGERSHVEPSARMVRHAWGLHEVLTHVPLVVKYPYQTKSQTVSEVATLTNFPDVVTAVLEDDLESDPFVPEDYVLASGGTLLKENVSKYPDVDIVNDLTGPWRAVYETDDEGVLKYIAREDSSATVRVVDAQTSYKIADDDNGVVADVYGDLKSAEISRSERKDISEDVENRLADLGYV